MFIRKLKTALVAAASASTVLVALASPASAAPVMFTWDPGLAPTGGNPLTAGVLPTEITDASLFGVQDWAALYSPSACNNPLALATCTTGLQHEHALLVVNTFDVPAFGLTDSIGGSGVGTNYPYVLFFEVDAKGHYNSFDASGTGTLTGVFDSLDLTFYGYGGTTDVTADITGVKSDIDTNGATVGQGNQACLSITFGGACVTTAATTGRFVKTTNSGTTGLVTLATGSLVTGGQNSITLTNVLTGTKTPGATVTASFTPNTAPGVAPFFVNPPATITLNLDAVFSNTSASVNLFTSGDCGTEAGGTAHAVGGGDLCFALKLGQGNATLSAVGVPEPTTLSLFGLGLLGLGFMSRRRRSESKKA